MGGSSSEVFPGSLLVLTFIRRHGEGNEGCRTCTRSKAEGHEGEGEGHEGKGHEGEEVRLARHLHREFNRPAVQRTPVVLALETLRLYHRLSAMCSEWM